MVMSKGIRRVFWWICGEVPALGRLWRRLRSRYGRCQTSLLSRPKGGDIPNGSLLVLAHSAGRSGAPFLLLWFLQWYRQRTDRHIEILLKSDGELRAEFERIGPVTLWGTPDVQRLTRQAGGFSTIYANTIVTGEMMAAFSDVGCRTVTHVHELESWIRKAGEENFDHVKRMASHFIAVSIAVRDNLVERHEIPLDRILVIPELIDFARVSDTVTNSSMVRDALGIPRDAYIVGGAGIESWRKGEDLFVQVAAAVSRRNSGRPVYWVWIGQESEQEKERLVQDAETCGIDKYVHLLPTVTNPLDYFVEYDVFLMTSREDPCPVVCLEAASLKKPIVCFEKAGGMSEFVGEDAGFVVPYLDVEAMADKVHRLLLDSGLRARMGRCAAQKVADRHDISIVAPQLSSLIDAELTEVPGGDRLL